MCELLNMWIQDCMMKMKIAKDQKKITRLINLKPRYQTKETQRVVILCTYQNLFSWNQLSCLHQNTNTSSCIGMFSLLCSVFFLLPAVLTLHQMFESFV
jgi:hypothetical protein